MISISYNYSTNDFEFLEQCIKESKIVSNDIHFTYVSKFFDGSDENEDLINKSAEICKANAVGFHKLEYSSEKKNPNTSDTHWFKYWHDITRYNNTIKCINDYVLYLDGDEIIDGTRLNEWAKSFDLNQYNSYLFNVFWYFRSKKFQAKTWEEGPVMTNKNNLFVEDIMDVSERWALIKNPYLRNVKSLDQIPMIHHYSWAKGNSDEECKKALLKKVKSWGHSSDRDWQTQILEEFSRPFNGKDFVHGYDYNVLS